MANPLPPMPDLSEADYRKLTSKSLIRSVDMSLEMSSECMEVITMAVDKHQNTKNYEVRISLFILYSPIKLFYYQLYFLSYPI